MAITRHAWIAAALLSATSAAARDLQDSYFGEALFYAYQGQYFEALERLDTEVAQHYRVDEPQRDSLQPHIKTAEFDVGDFELRYRMHQRAGRAIKAVIEGDVDETVRNDAIYRLARIYFQKGQPEDALRALEKIEGRVPEEIRDEVEFLRANIYLALGRSTAAVDDLLHLQRAPGLRGFADYNLGIALLEDGRRDEAIDQLDRAGQVSSDDPATLAIRDKSNLVLGTLLFESSDFEHAERSLDRVRLEGPFSNQALLRAGWADATAQKFDRALVPWALLAGRDPTDAAVQEAILALPYAYSRLNVHGRAAILYGHAVGSFGQQLEKLDASLRSVRQGEFLKDLAREEIRQDKDWVIRLRSLPDAPETFYLTNLIASHDFQTALQNYLDLEDMRKKLVAWQRSLDAFDDLVRLRRAYYEPLLPDIDARFRKLDAQMRLRLEQRKAVEKRIQDLLVAPRPDFLATAEEQSALARLERVESALSAGDDDATRALRARVRRLQGFLAFNLATDYHRRLTDAYEHLHALNRDVAVLTAQYDAFVRTRQAATHGYEGYEPQIRSLRARVGDALERLEPTMAQQGRVLEVVAMRELESRRERLEAYQNQARFAFADSYDRAAKAQAQ